MVSQIHRSQVIITWLLLNLFRLGNRMQCRDASHDDPRYFRTLGLDGEVCLSWNENEEYCT